MNAYADHVISLLPPLWEQAGDEYLLKQTILGILSALITAMKAECSRFQALIVPLIESSVRPDSTTREYLLEDALELWSSLITQTKEPTPSQITDLLPHLLPIYEIGSEVLVKGLEITEQYILLRPEAVLKAAPQIATAFTTLLSGNLRTKVMGKVVRVIEVLLQMAQELGGASGVQAVTGILIETKFLHQVLAGIKSANDAHQTTGPNRTHTDIEGITETDYLALLARILWSSPPIFAEAVVAVTGTADSLDWILKEWWSHCQDVGNTERLKLMCLALGKLFELDDASRFFNWLQEYITSFTEVVLQCRELDEDDNGTAKDCLVYDDIDSLKYEGMPEAPEDERRRKVSRDALARRRSKLTCSSSFSVTLCTAPTSWSSSATACRR